jgi:hypothetical protein
MRAVYVEPKRTPIPFSTAVDCMRWALQFEIGAPPSVEVLALALAKTALETGRWTQIWNANWGNVKAPDTYEGMFTCITLNEVLLGRGVVWFAPEGELTAAPSRGGRITGKTWPVPDGHPQTRMKAFANEYNGVESYVDFIKNGRYAQAWLRLLAGDAVGYVHQLKARGYFTADEAPYAKGVVSLQREFAARLRQEAPAVSDIEWSRLLHIVPTLQFDLAHMVDNEFVEAVA